MEEKYLYPNPTCPVPLRENFWKELIVPQTTNGEQFASDAYREAEIRARNVETEVDRTLRLNKDAINASLMKQIAPTAVNVTENVYNNLIDLSFDEEELIRQQEEKQKKARDKIIKSALKK
ncbi:hypothetical protein AB6A40_000263 [Gnathostoma spinigerum]|uniref:Uncharacterized protein n=1 Tax=Gnathostoma spinigerum TaxID=75299 RepID=A0ABD6E614_9BILA